MKTQYVTTEPSGLCLLDKVKCGFWIYILDSFAFGGFGEDGWMLLIDLMRGLILTHNFCILIMRGTMVEMMWFCNSTYICNVLILYG